MKCENDVAVSKPTHVVDTKPLVSRPPPRLVWMSINEMEKSPAKQGGEHGKWVCFKLLSGRCYTDRRSIMTLTIIIRAVPTHNRKITNQHPENPTAMAT